MMNSSTYDNYRDEDALRGDLHLLRLDEIDARHCIDIEHVLFGDVIMFVGADCSFKGKNTSESAANFLDTLSSVVNIVPRWEIYDDDDPKY